MKAISDFLRPIEAHPPILNKYNIYRLMQLFLRILD